MLSLILLSLLKWFLVHPSKLILNSLARLSSRILLWTYELNLWSDYALRLLLSASSRFSGSMLTFSFLGLISFATRMLIPLFLTRPITIGWREV